MPVPRRAAEVQMLGDVGIVTFEGELTATPKKGGKATTHTIKGVHIFKKQADGSWKISQDVYSNDPATAK